MWRRTAPVLGFLCTASSPLPDMAGVGEAAAKLSDSQTNQYFLMVVIISFMIERAWAGIRHSRTADKFAAAATKLSEMIQSDSTSLTVNLAMIQRELADARAERAKIIALLDAIE